MIGENIQGIQSKDMQLQGVAFQALMLATKEPVSWSYEVWDDLLALLNHKDNRTRSIAAQVLCNLAKSDPKARMAKDVRALLVLTKDPKFVTARHCLQSLWKVGAAGPQQRQALLKGLSQRFAECAAEKNCTLIRYDICVCLRQILNETEDQSIDTVARKLIETETDLKYQKKYLTVWK